MNELKWALPETLEIPPDQLKVRLDFYEESVVLSIMDNGTVSTRLVSVNDIAMALLRQIPLSSGLLPPDTLWWGTGAFGTRVGLWRPPRVWPVAIMGSLDQPPVRLKLPLPGLIFVCSPAQPPRVYAAKERPKALETPIYHAPLYNLFRDGRSCAGTHNYPGNVGEIPESFFASFFTTTADSDNRSKKYPHNLMDLWREINGRRKYPLSDLMRCGTVNDIFP